MHNEISLPAADADWPLPRVTVERQPAFGISVFHVDHDNEGTLPKQAIRVGRRPGVSQESASQSPLENRIFVWVVNG
jgi:hypothetical protein